jgi:hypothetical protein
LTPPRGNLPPEVLKIGKWVAICVGGVLALSALASHIEAWWDEPSTTQQGQSASPPMTSLPLANWPLVQVPAGGDSIHLPVPVGMDINPAGYGFKLHEVFSNGGSCVKAPPVNTCPPANVKPDIDYVYLEDTSGTTRWVPYAYFKTGI